MGARGGLAPERPERPEPACLPFVPETDVLTTIPIVNLARVRPGRPGADLLERLGPSVASPLPAGERLVRTVALSGRDPCLPG